MNPATFLERAGRYTYFAYRSALAAPMALRQPGNLLKQLYQVQVGALPLSLVAGLALGVVIWLHLHGVLARMGPGYKELLPHYLALAVVLEFAPLGAGFIVAGRSGASLGAELGAMKLTEQIDALEVLGISPWRQLVGPRVLACMIALPFLTVIIAFLALVGGYLAEHLGGTMTWRSYWTECLRGLLLEDIIPATLKTIVFGYLIGVTGCYFGMTAQGGTEGVGEAATRGVVLSIFAVVVSNVFLVRLIQLI